MNKIKIQMNKTKIYEYLIRENNPEYSLLTTYLNELITALIPLGFKEPLIINMRSILSKSSDLHWSSYCLHRDNANVLHFSQPCDDIKQIDGYLPWLANVYGSFSIFVKDIKKICITIM